MPIARRPAPTTPRARARAETGSRRSAVSHTAPRAGARVARLFLAAAALAPASAAQAVHVVDAAGGPGVDFVDLPAAVAAAASGDVLLVHGGTYSGFDLRAKSLTVTASAGAQVVLASAWRIRDLPAGGRVVLRGLAVEAAADACRVEGCAGWVGLEDCASGGLAPGASAPAALVIEASTVIAVRSSASPGAPSGAVASAAVRVRDGALHAFGCALEGAAAAPAGDGGAAVELEDAVLFASGCALTGGAGGDGAASGACADGGDGGAGLSADAGSLAWLQDVAITGGAGGAASGAPCAAGADGAATIGATVALPGGARVLDVDTPVAMGAIATNVLRGEPGELVVLGIALGPGAQVVPPWAGALAIQPPLFTAVLGVVPASGALVVGVLVPVLAGLEGLQLYEQAMFVGPGGALALSSPSLPLILAPGF